MMDQILYLERTFTVRDIRLRHHGMPILDILHTFATTKFAEEPCDQRTKGWSEASDLGVAFVVDRVCAMRMKGQGGQEEGAGGSAGVW